MSLENRFDWGQDTVVLSDNGKEKKIMPYDGPNDSKLPDHIKKMPANKRAKFISIFNSSHSKCMKDGGKDCEAMAFRMANGSMKETNVSKERYHILEKASHTDVFDFNRAEISEATFGDTTGKKEMVVTLLREGPGNKFHNNYYTKSALETAMGRLKNRPKQYFNHAKNIDDPDRDVRDWASSIVETWIDHSEGKSKLKARVKVFDNWLWERAKVAPDELAVSIEGKGSGKSEVIEGKPYNAIYEIENVNGVNWVDYPGNAGMGVNVLENNKLKEEVTTMTANEILEAMKELPADDLKSVIESRQDLKEFFFFPPKDEATDKKVAELSEAVKKIKADAEAEAKKLSEKLDAINGENATLKNKVEAHELKEKEMAKERMIEKLLKDSKLKEAHITETFKATLQSVKEYKKDDAVITEEAQVKSLIEDREKVCIGELGSPNDGGKGNPSPLSEKEKVKNFCLNILGENPYSDLEAKEAAAAGK